MFLFPFCSKEEVEGNEGDVEDMESHDEAGEDGDGKGSWLRENQIMIEFISISEKESAVELL